MTPIAEKTSRPLKRLMALTMLSAMACPFLVQADENENWRIRAGIGSIYFDENVALRAGGMEVPGANGWIKNNTSFLVEFGYLFNPNWSVGLTIGYPPATKLVGTGSVAAVGEVGSVRYGPAALTLQYTLDAIARFKPYVGAGIAYNKIFSSKDGAVSGLSVDSTFGRTLQLGVEYPLSERSALFLDFKKIFLKTVANGDLQGAPVHADIRLNPSVVHAGVSLYF